MKNVLYGDNKITYLYFYNGIIQLAINQQQLEWYKLGYLVTLK